MLRHLVAVWLVSLALFVHCAEAQNETATAPTLTEILTPGFFPNLTGELLEVLLSPDVFNFQTVIAIRYALLFFVSDYEIIAACHPVALSFYGTKDEIPDDFCSPLNQRIIASYIMYRVLSSEFPRIGANFARFLTRLGLTPLNESRDKATLNGWANVIADRLVNYFSKDGFNSLGDLTRDNFRQAFSDQTGYKPENPAFLPPDKLKRPLRWQPLTGEKDGSGDFLSQVHVVPQVGSAPDPLVLTREEFLGRKLESPYRNPNMLGSIDPDDEALLRRSLKTIFERSEQMTPKKLALVYYWDNKFSSVAGFNGYYRTRIGYDRSTFIRNALGEHLAFHDSMLLAWKEKVRHDLVRPTTMIRRLLKGEMVTGFRGLSSGVGVVKASEWEPAIPPQPHSEFPSATAAICTAGFEQLKYALNDIVGNGTIPPYELVINSGPLGLISASPVTAEIPIKFDNLDIATRECGYSRLDGGVHFPHSIPAGFELGKGVGKKAYLHVKDLWEGRVPEVCARCIRS